MDQSWIRQCCQIIATACVISSTLQLQRHPHGNNNCKQTWTTLICVHDIPNQVPDGITDVYISDYNSGHINKQSQGFSHLSWQSVRKLDITINPKPDDQVVHNYDFYKLKNLVTLGIHAKVLGHIQPNAFIGLDNISHIDLSGCERLTNENIVTSLSYKNNKTLKNLKFLTLDYLHTVNGKFFRINNNFMDMIITREIKNLSISGTNLLIEDLQPPKKTPSLEFLDISNTSAASINTGSHIRMFFETVKTMNVSNVPSRFFHVGYDFQNKIIVDDCSKIPAKLENLYANNIIDKPLIVNNVSADFSNCQLKVKTLHFRGNNFRKVNATIQLPSNMEISEIDMSSNGMEYLSPKLFDHPHQIRHFFLSNNSLFKMEMLPEFEDLLKTFFYVEILCLDHNKLTFIPNTMFINTKNLQILDLSGNHLSSISFQLDSLDKLKMLDVRNNEILYLQGGVLSQLQLFFHQKMHKTNSFFAISFLRNPLQCSCESFEFIKWLTTDVQPITKEALQCQSEDVIINIDMSAVEKASYLCKRTTIIVAISITSLIATSVIAGLSVYVSCAFKKQINKMEINRFLDEFKNDQLEQKYLAFISHNSDDGDLVMQFIYTNLDNTLKQIIGMGDNNGRDIVGIGELHFTPGFSIFDEMARCIASSFVVIFVISEGFCKSKWCRYELEQAYQQEKPIILIFKEHVEPNLMPPFLLNIFQKYTRVQIVKRHGHYTILPTWQSLCQSVILLASQQRQ